MIKIKDQKIICPLIEEGNYEISGLNLFPKFIISKGSRKIGEIKLEINGNEILYDELWLITFEEPNILYFRLETKTLPMSKKNNNDLDNYKTLIIKGTTEHQLLNFSEQPITTITKDENNSDSFEMIDLFQINCNKHILKKVESGFNIEKIKSVTQCQKNKQCLELEIPQSYKTLNEYFNSWGIICK